MADSNRFSGNTKNSGRGQRELKASVKSARGKTVSLMHESVLEAYGRVIHY